MSLIKPRLLNEMQKGEHGWDLKYGETNLQV